MEKKDTVIDSFRYEDNFYVVEFKSNNSFVFYREVLDTFTWGEVIRDESISRNVKNPVPLMRRIAGLIRNYIYANKLPYFSFSAKDRKRNSIYTRFLDSLEGYEYYTHRRRFYVNRVKLD